MLTEGRIVDGLLKLGLRRGDAVEVHSSLRSFGRVEGGPRAVLSALMAAVGPEGTLVMSAYPLSPPVPLSEAERARGLRWKVRVLPEDSPERTGMGAVVDAFKRAPGVSCGHGRHRVCAWGKDAALHSQGYAHLVAADGWALLLGVGIDRCSSLHLADDASAAVELPDDIKRDYDPSAWDVGYEPVGPAEPARDPEPEGRWEGAFAEADRQGLVRHARIGEATCHLFRVRPLIAMLRRP